MKKSIFILAAMLIAVLTACSSGYDQKVVDALDENNLSTADYKIMIEQTGYALDDSEKASDLKKWIEENEKEAESMAGMIMALELCSELDTEFPEDLKKDVATLSKRADKIFKIILNENEDY